MTNTRRRFLTGTGAILASATAAHAFAPQDIFEAAAAGNLERAKELCQQTPGIVHSRSQDGRTPLHYATAGGQPDMVMFINGQGADLSAGPESPMVAVAGYPDPAIAEEMARTLLGNASDLNAKRKDGKSLLQVAVARGNMRVAEILVHRGAKVDAEVPGAEKIERMYGRGKHEDMNGQPQTVINQFVTIAHTNFDTVKQMHKQTSALLSTRATWDETAIEAAAHMGLVPMTVYLSDAGADVSICTAALLGDAKRVRSLLDADRNRLRERGAHDFALLNYTMFAEERAEIASMLLEAGASANPFVMGAGPLHMAAGKGYLEIARLLVDHHADVNATYRTRKGAGPTPLAVAIQRKQDKMVEFLKEHGGITG